MKHAWLWYSLIRLALFAALVALAWALGAPLLLAAAIGAVLALVISYFALAPLRGKFSAELSGLSRHREPSDEEVEDSATALPNAPQPSPEDASGGNSDEHAEAQK